MPQETRYFVVWDAPSLDDKAIQADFMEVDKVIFDTAIGTRHRHLDYNLAYYFLVVDMLEKDAIEAIKRYLVKWYTDKALLRICNGDVTSLSLQHGKYVKGKRTVITEAALWKVVSKDIENARRAKRV